MIHLWLKILKSMRRDVEKCWKADKTNKDMKTVQLLQPEKLPLEGAGEQNSRPLHHLQWVTWAMILKH
jgi:hypothetical protein